MCKYHKVWKVTTPWKKKPFKSSNRISKLLTKQIPKVPILQKWWWSECSDLKCAQLLWCNIYSFEQGFPISSFNFFSLIWIGLHVVHDYLIQPLLNQHHWHLQWPKNSVWHLTTSSFGVQSSFGRIWCFIDKSRALFTRKCLRLYSSEGRRFMASTTSGSSSFNRSPLRRPGKNSWMYRRQSVTISKTVWCMICAKISVCDIHNEI